MAAPFCGPSRDNALLTAVYMTRMMAMTFWGEERFREAHAGGQADEAHAHAHDEGHKPHDAEMASAGDRRITRPAKTRMMSLDEDEDDHAHARTATGPHVPHECVDDDRSARRARGALDRRRTCWRTTALSSCRPRSDVNKLSIFWSRRRARCCAGRGRRSGLRC